MGYVVPAFQFGLLMIRETLCTVALQCSNLNPHVHRVASSLLMVEFGMEWQLKPCIEHFWSVVPKLSSSSCSKSCKG